MLKGIFEINKRINVILIEWGIEQSVLHLFLPFTSKVSTFAT